LTAALLGCFVGAAAQDVTILHMKDGTTKRYTNGVKWKTSMGFYEYTPVNTKTFNSSTTHDNGYVYDWGVTQVQKVDGEYMVGLFWQDFMPDNFHARHGVCFGTKPGLTVDDCLAKEYATDEVVVKRDNSSINFVNVFGGHSYYMWIGARKSTNLEMFIGYGDNPMKLVTVDTLVNYITIPLEIGKTYYYRTFAEGTVLEAGLEKTVVFYDDERSFQVPRVMGDFGYYPYLRATEEALTAFANAHLDSLATLTWQQLEPLWNKWRATDEGKNYDLSADITSEKFDDGTGYRLNRIPDEFYIWAANREIVIDAFDGLAEVSKYYDKNTKDSVSTALEYRVTNVDPKWGVPGGKYILFKPTNTIFRPQITYRSDEVMAGVKYKIQFNFAPETDEFATDMDLRPTKVRIGVKAPSGNKFQSLNYPDGRRNIEVSATEVTTYEIQDFVMPAMGLDLQYENNVSISETKLDGNNPDKVVYNRILRIAEVRLIPMKDE